MEKGERRTKKAVAQRLFAMGMTLEQVAEITQLSLADLQNLQH